MSDRRQVFLALLITEFPLVAVASLLSHGHNLHRDIVGVTIDRDTALDNRQRQPFDLQEAVVGADEGSQLCACRMAHHEDRVGITSVLCGMIVGPPDRLGHISGHRLDRHVGEQAIVRRNEFEALVHERMWLLLHVSFVALHPSAAMNLEDDGTVFAIGGA